MIRVLSILMLLAAPGVAQQAPAPAEQPAQAVTLEDVRLALDALDRELQDLRRQLVSGGAPLGTGASAGSLLQRLDRVEAQMRGLTGRVELLQNDVRRIAEDGGRRIADLDFRLTELEGSDTSFVPPASDLGGGVTTPPAQTGAGGAQTALSEQNAFDAAKATFEAGSFAAAAAGFEGFLESYPGGPLANEARFWLAESQASQNNHRDAALNYLNAFSGAPTGPLAPDALFKLGGSLGVLGQTVEACLTLDEALARFAAAEGDDFVSKIQGKKAELACS